MLIKISGKPLTIKCNEQVFPEFPELLFGTSTEDGKLYFDSEQYLKTKGYSSTTLQFLENNQKHIENICNAFDLPKTDVCKTNSNGSFLLESRLTYLFLFYYEQSFIQLSHYYLNNLFHTGFCVSDSMLYELAKERIPVELLKEMSNE